MLRLSAGRASRDARNGSGSPGRASWARQLARALAAAGVLAGLAAVPNGALAASGEGEAETPTALSPSATSTSPEGQQGARYGSVLAENEQFRVVGASGQSVGGVSEAGEVFVYDSQTGALVQRLVTPAPVEGGRFGAAVAVEGEDVIVGAPGSGEEEVGSVYVFDASSGKLLRTIGRHYSGHGGRFGASLAVDGEGDLVVGAPDERSGFMVKVTDGTVAAHDGIAYVFSVSSGLLLQTFTSPAPGLDGAFGASVAVSGEDVVVGAPGQTAGGLEKAGSAYVFSQESGELTQTLQSPAPREGGEGEFGSAVAISDGTVAVGEAGGGQAFEFDAGDGALTRSLVDPHAPSLYNSLGRERFGSSIALDSEYLVVGAPGATVEGVMQAGDAYVYGAVSGQLTATLTPSEPQAAAGFAEAPGSVLISADSVRVGAWGETANGLLSAGEAYAFGLPSAPALAPEEPVQPAPPVGLTTPSAPALMSPDAEEDAVYGSAVAEDAGFRVVGAPGQSVGGASETGEAFVYDSQTGVLLQRLQAPDPVEGGGRFGAAVAVDGEDVIVGAPDEAKLFDASDEGGVALRIGYVYVFDATTGRLLRTIISPNRQAGGLFGASLAVDGEGALVVGAPSQGEGKGSAYVFSLGSGLLVQTLRPDRVSDDDVYAFGASVAVSGEEVVVGAPDVTVGGLDRAGSAYVFDEESGAMLQTLESPAPKAGGGGLFGLSVAVSDGQVAVGEGAGGQAFQFDARSGALTRSLTDPNAASSAGERFGSAVALDSEYLIVGAPGASSQGVSQAGAAYVYGAVSGQLTFTLVSSEAQRNSLFAEGPARPEVNPGYSGVTLPVPSAAALSLDGDHVTVGAPDQTVSGVGGAGAAYAFKLSEASALASETLTQPVGVMAPTGPALTSPEQAEDGRYGSAVAEDGEFRVVGAPGQDAPDADGTSLSEGGAAYLYDTATGALLYTLHSPNAFEDGRFGAAVAVAGEDVIVGAPDENGKGRGGPFATPPFGGGGNVYVFNASSGALLGAIEDPGFKLPEGTERGAYGFGDALAADSEGTLVVGAPVETHWPENGETEREAIDRSPAGAAYVYDLSDGVPTLPSQRLATPPFTAVSEEHFGMSVAVDGEDVVVGAPGQTANGIEKAGVAYVYSAKTGGLLRTLMSPEPWKTAFPLQVEAEGAAFGSAVAVSGGTVAVGEVGGGQAFVFNAATGALEQKLADPNAASRPGGERFGAALALDSEYLVVLAPGANAESVRQAGAAYVYAAGSGQLTATLQSSTPERFALFGEVPNYVSREFNGYELWGNPADALAINGANVLMGAWGQTSGGLAGAGAAYRFDLAGPTEPTKQPETSKEPAEPTKQPETPKEPAEPTKEPETPQAPLAQSVLSVPAVILTPDDTPPPTGAAGSSSQEASKAKHAKKTSAEAKIVKLTASGATVKIALSCPEGATCGQSTVQVSAPAASHKKATQSSTVVIAKGSVSLKAGSTSTVTLKLNRVARKLLARHRKLQAIVIVSAHSNTIATRRLTIR